MLTKKQKEKDFLYLHQVMSDNYPFLKVKERQYGIDWLANKQNYIERLTNTNDDTAYFNELTSILNELQDDHLGLISPHTIMGLKSVYDEINLKVWSEKLDEALADYLYWDPIIPKQHVSVSNENCIYEIKELNDGDVIYLKIPKFKLSKTSCEEMQQSLLNYGQASNIIIDIRGNWGGNSANWSNYLVPALMAEPITTAFIFTLRGGPLLDEYIPSSRFPSKDVFQPIGELPLELNYPAEIHTDFKYFLTVPFQLQPCENCFNGKIYLLVDNKVYSSAEALTAWCKQTGFATIVGENTKGDGIGTDPVFFQLPHSRLMITIPLILGLSADGRANVEYGTVPDIECDPSEALGIVLNIINNTSDD